MYRRKFYSTTNGLNSVCGDKPQLVGGIGEINFGKQYRQGNRVYDSNEIAMCLLSQPVGNVGGYSYLYTVDELEKTNKIIKYDIQQTVKVRKYQVDIENLKQCLRLHKNISNKIIANKLNKPITLVEHWFRNDDCFFIPDADIWYDLKELLNIETIEFDNSITKFIEKPNEYEISNRYYDSNGIAPTLTCCSETSAPKIII